MSDPTPSQLRVMAAYVRTGDRRAAADELGLTLPTVRESLRQLYARLDVTSALQAAGKLGWVHVPDMQERHRRSAGMDRPQQRRSALLP